MNIYFIGLIGSGKTTLGSILSQRLGWPFFDLDQEMDRELGKSFHELVQKEGWLPFREREYNICKQFSKIKKAVIALGGGTIRYEWNRDVLEKTGITILLEADISVLIERVRIADRPRVNPGVSLEEDLQSIWKSSKQLYYQAADLIYRTDNEKSIAEEVEEIIHLIKSYGFFTKVNSTSLY